MIQYFRGEEFREVIIAYDLKLRYAVSNYGRLISFEDEFKNGKELKGSLIEGYRVMRYKTRVDGKLYHKTLMIYKLVGELFLEKEREDQIFVLHLDYNKQNDHVNNLKWANQEEFTAHHRKNPAVIAGRDKTLAHNIKADGRKLTSTQVIRIKKMLQRPDNKTRLTIIAKQFNVTTQQLWRIKTGENWGHIKV
jgi:hypothetical protein